MPKPEYPGVYVEEFDGRVHTIEGVPTSTDAETLKKVVAAMRAAAGDALPGWIDFNETDPSVTVIEVFAYLAENLLYRSSVIPQRSRNAALRAATALVSLTNPCAAESEPLRRMHFFNGRLLDAATLQAEQDYHREARRRHNRALVGWGIAGGLGIGVEGTPNGGRVIVEPGYAIDACGEEIALRGGAMLELPRDSDEAYVRLRFGERPCEPLPATPGGPCNFGCIEEGCIIGLAARVAPPALAIGRVVRIEGGWRVDETFDPPRLRSATR